MGAVDLRSAVFMTPRAEFLFAGQFLYSRSFENDVFPSIIDRLFDFRGYVPDGRCWNYLIPAMNESIEALVIPERVWCFSKRVQVCDLAPVLQLTFAPQRCKWIEI